MCDFARSDGRSKTFGNEQAHHMRQEKTEVFDGYETNEENGLAAHHHQSDGSRFVSSCVDYPMFRLCSESLCI
jgi:hypothetical protein